MIGEKGSAKREATWIDDATVRDREQFLNRLRILRSLDSCEVPNLPSWPDFRGDPYEYLIRCSDADADHIWTALRKREK